MLYYRPGNNVVAPVRFSRGAGRLPYWHTANSLPESVNSMNVESPLHAWKEAIEQHGFVHDPAQARAVQALQHCHEQLEDR